MVDVDTEHLLFAKKLASNDLEVRNKAITDLKTLFAHCPVLPELDFLKLWKGLFYSMWMSDKPVVQSELAENISKSILSHHNAENAITFIKTFFVTINREFTGIDRLRHDKYLKFVRYFMHSTFEFIKKQEYSMDVVEKIVQALDGIFSSDDAQELIIQVSEVFYEELYLACGNDVPSEVLFRFAELFADKLGRTPHQNLKRFLSFALKFFIHSASYCSPKLENKKKNNIDSDKSMFPDVEFVNVSLDELEAWFLKHAATQGNVKNRNLLFDLHTEATIKKKAEPGFKLIPRGRITEKVLRVEETEYHRLMLEHVDHIIAAEGAEEKEARESNKLKQKKAKKGQGKKEEGKKEGEKEGQEQEEEEEEEEEDGADEAEANGKKTDKKKRKRKGDKQGEAPAPAPASKDEEKGKEEQGKPQKKAKTGTAPTPPKEDISPAINNNKKNDKKNKQDNKKEETTATTTKEAPTVTTTTTTKTSELHNEKGEVVGKEMKQTVVTENDNNKKIEVTTTTTTKSVKKTPVKDNKPEEKKRQEGSKRRKTKK